MAFKNMNPIKLDNTNKGPITKTKHYTEKYSNPNLTQKT